MRKPVLSLAFLAIGIAACSSAPPMATPSSMLTPGLTMPKQDKSATVLPDGLAYQVLRRGYGKQHPVLSDYVTANYSLWYPNGQMIESSCKDQPCAPATFPLDKLIPGWQEMIPLMTVGETVDLWLPVQLAYGDPPRKPNRPFGPLVFEIQLVGIGQQPPTPPAAAEQHK